MWALLLVMGFTAFAHANPVRILAASSLTEAMTEATQDHTVSLNFGGSGRLATQVLSGAPADIVALAHPEWVESLSNAGLIDRSIPLLGNQLVVATPKGTSPAVKNLSTLAKANKIAIGSESTPAGQYAREAIQSLGLDEAIQPNLLNASNVRAVLAHLSAGTVDAGFVYRSDLAIAPDLELRFVVDPGLHSSIEIPFALTKEGANNPVAVTVFERLTGEEGKKIFLNHGFVEAPESTDATRTALKKSEVQSMEPIVISLWVGGISLLLSIVPALGLGWLMARREFRFKAVLSTVCLAPLVLPPVVTGWLLLQTVAAIGLPLAFTRWAAVLAAAVVGFPLILILTRQAIESVDNRYPQLAETLGLTPFEAFLRVTLPMALPGIAAGCVLAFARALGEFGATAMIAGDQPGETRTLALAVYALAEQPDGTKSAAMLVACSVLITLIALVAYERLVWRQRQLTGEQL